MPTSSRDHTPRLDSVAAFPRLTTAVAIPTSAAPSSSEASASASASPPIPPAPAPHATSSLSKTQQGTVPAPAPGSSSPGRVRRATASDALASYSTSSRSRSHHHPEDIEMDPINPTGHRRRRSSLMSPPGTTTTHTGQGFHSRGPSGQFHSNEPKISEESQSTIKDKHGVMRHLAPDDFSDEDLHDDEETGLTAKERRRKQKKKRRNTLLDQRIAADTASAEEKKVAHQTVIRKLTVNGILIGLWYLFSLCISLVSRYLQPACRPASPKCRRCTMLTRRNSITSGCSIPNGSTSPSLYLQPPYICLCSSRSLPWSSTLYHH